MVDLRTLGLRMAIMSVIAASIATLNCQQVAIVQKTASFAVSIKLKQDPVPAGEKPWVTLTSRNVSDHFINVGNGLPWRLHVAGEKGEPKRTLYHRQLQGEPDVPALAAGGPSRSPLNIEGEEPYKGVPPGGADVMQFDLSMYYDLIPGRYIVYLEVQDVTGAWLRTNKVQFEIKASGQ